MLGNAIVVHVDEAGHLPKWENAKVLEKGMDRDIMECIGSGAHEDEKYNQHRGWIYTLSHTTAKLVLHLRSAPS